MELCEHLICEIDSEEGKLLRAGDIKEEGNEASKDEGVGPCWQQSPLEEPDGCPLQHIAHCKSRGAEGSVL